MLTWIKRILGYTDETEEYFRETRDAAKDIRDMVVGARDALRARCEPEAVESGKRKQLAK